MFQAHHQGLAQQQNSLFLEKSPNTIICHSITPSSLLLPGHMANLMILLTILLTLLVEKSPRSGDPRERSFLYRMLYVTLQRFNSILVLFCFPVTDRLD